MSELPPHTIEQQTTTRASLVMPEFLMRLGNEDYIQLVLSEYQGKERHEFRWSSDRDFDTGVRMAFVNLHELITFSQASLNVGDGHGTIDQRVDSCLYDIGNLMLHPNIQSVRMSNRSFDFSWAHADNNWVSKYHTQANIDAKRHVVTAVYHAASPRPALVTRALTQTGSFLVKRAGSKAVTHLLSLGATNNNRSPTPTAS